MLEEKSGPDLQPVTKLPQCDPKIFYPNPINRVNQPKNHLKSNLLQRNVEGPEKVQVLMRLQNLKEEISSRKESDLG